MGQPLNMHERAELAEASASTGTQTYIGTKIITAWPETKDGAAGFAVVYSGGYRSWSPTAAFAEAYRPTTGGMNFGHALELMKKGARVARAGWNGKGMFVALQRGSEIAIDQARGGAAVYRADELRSAGSYEPIPILPHIDMRAADGSIVVGWLASQTDMLADDWQVVA